MAHGRDGDGKEEEEEEVAAGEIHGLIRANEGDIGLPGPCERFGYDERLIVWRF